MQLCGISENIFLPLLHKFQWNDIKKKIHSTK